MSTKIFYFSGTGNSLQLARMIASKIPSAELIPAVSFLSKPLQPVTADAVGFIFPVYYLDVPEIMQKIVNHMGLEEVDYVFSAATCGGDSGNSHHTLNRLLQAKGKRLHLGFEVPIGDNSIVYTTPADVLARRIAHLDQTAAEIASRVLAHETTSTPIPLKAGAVVMKQVLKMALNQYYQIGRKSVDAEKCTRCGLCDNVCPVNNIRIQNGTVTFADQCESCFACLNWCPRQAIRFGKIEMSRRAQYRYPGMKASDLMAQKVEGARTP